jgi:hypothetical protein
MLVTSCSKDSARPGESSGAPGPVAPPASVASAPAGGASASEAGASPSALASARPVAGATGETKLLDPGQPPRRKLRYTWHPDQKEQLTMDLRTSATAEVGGTKQEFPLPAVHIVIDIDPRTVTSAGDLRYDWRVSAANMSVDPQMAAEIVQGMRTEVAAVEHLAGSATVSSRGLSSDVTIDPRTVVDGGATGQMVDQVGQTLRDAAVPFPEEEVGRGARWQRISQLDAPPSRSTESARSPESETDANPRSGAEVRAAGVPLEHRKRDEGARLTQTDTFTLVEVQADKGTVDDVLAQAAPAQPLRAPGVTQARVESLLASGQAKSVFDLSRLVPQTKFDGTTTMVVSGQQPGLATRRGTMVMRLGFDIQGKTR